MVKRVRVREISNDEGNRLLRTVRRSSGSVVNCRRAQIVLLSAQGMDVPAIAQVTFTSADRVRDVIHIFNTDGFDSLRPRYAGGRPTKFGLAQRARITTLAPSRSADRGWLSSTCSLAKRADFLVGDGVVDDISHEGLRGVLRDQGCLPSRRSRTFKTSTDPGPGDPEVVICMDEFGPLNLQPHPGRQWAPVAAGTGTQSAPRWRRRRATCKRPHGVRHLLAGYDLSTDRLYGTSRHAKAVPSSSPSPATCAPCTRHTFGSRSCWTTSPRTCPPAPTTEPETEPRPATSNGPTSFYGSFSWQNRIEAQFAAIHILLAATHRLALHPRQTLARRVVARVAAD